MASGISIHIGLNSVDPVAYGGWAGELTACEFDANDMAALAKDRGFQPTVIHTAEATSERLLGALADAAEALCAGDTLLLSYSGHGGQVPDSDGDESDRADETWVLYDRQVIDDELFAAYGRFAPGVRIAVLSDSCHSGTVIRRILAPVVGEPVAPPVGEPAAGEAEFGPRTRLMPPEIAVRDFNRRKDTYTEIARRTAGIDAGQIPATVLLISGCRDDQVSLDGTFNGLFTSRLLTTWNRGAFAGGYRALRDQIVTTMPVSQTPQFSTIGTADATFAEQEQAFSI